MEKFCPRCGRVLGKVDFKYCPYCQSQLKQRAGRQPIPGKLRHKVFVRDNYRCVECGATNKETALEIDHIIPVSKGGTNDINNLQTLCKACNRAKSATIWNDGAIYPIYENNLHLKSITAKMKEERSNANPKPLLENLSDWGFKKLCNNLSITPLSKSIESIDYLTIHYDSYFLEKSIKQVNNDEKYFSKRFLSGLKPQILYDLSNRLLDNEKRDKNKLISELVNKFSYDVLKEEVKKSQEYASFYAWVHSLNEDELYFILNRLYIVPKDRTKDRMANILVEKCSEEDVESIFKLLEMNPDLANDHKPIKVGNELLDNLSDDMINKLFINFKVPGNEKIFSKEQKLNYLSSYDEKLLKKAMKVIDSEK